MLRAHARCTSFTRRLSDVVTSTVIVTMPFSKLLSELYYGDGPESFSSVRRLYLAAKRREKAVRLSDVEKFFDQQPTATKFRKRWHKFPRNKFLVSHSNLMYGADLADMSNSQMRYNKQHRYVLIIQDLFSREIICLLPMRNKTAAVTGALMDMVFGRRCPTTLITDKVFPLLLFDEI